MIHSFEFINKHTYCSKSIVNKYKFSPEQSFLGFRASGSRSPLVRKTAVSKLTSDSRWRPRFGAILDFYHDTTRMLLNKRQPRYERGNCTQYSYLGRLLFSHIFVVSWQKSKMVPNRGRHLEYDVIGTRLDGLHIDNDSTRAFFDFARPQIKRMPLLRSQLYILATCAVHY